MNDAADESTTGAEMSEEEIRKAIEAELKQVSVEQVTVQSLATLLNVAGLRMGLSPGTEGDQDLQQVALAIEAAAALLGVVEGKGVPQYNEFQSALSNLRLAYAKLSENARQESPLNSDENRKVESQESINNSAEKSREGGGLWVPPGT